MKVRWTSFWFHGGKFVVPTRVKSLGRYYGDENPTVVIDAGDLTSLIAVLKGRIGIAVPTAPLPSAEDRNRQNKEKSEYWRQGGAASWRQFVREMKGWEIAEDDRDFLLVPQKAADLDKKPYITDDLTHAVRVAKIEGINRFLEIVRDAVGAEVSRIGRQQ